MPVLLSTRSATCHQVEEVQELKKKEKSKKKVKEVQHEWVVLNKQKPIW